MQTAREQAALDAKEGYKLTLKMPCYLPVMQFADSSALRETLHTMQEEQQGERFGTCVHCAHFERLSARATRCGFMGDRLSGPETRKICWLYAPKGSVGQE